MHRRAIECRLQNIINLDQSKNKQLALKTKSLNNKLHFACITNEIFQIDYFEKSKNNQELLSKINELESLLEETKAEQIRIKQKIHRITKKNETPFTQNTYCQLTNTDRTIHLKKLFKLKFLKECTKLYFVENKSSCRTILKGYVSNEIEMYPFERKISGLTSPEDISCMLWDNIKESSNYLNQWNELFEPCSRRTL